MMVIVLLLPPFSFFLRFLATFSSKIHSCLLFWLPVGATVTQLRSRWISSCHCSIKVRSDRSENWAVGMSTSLRRGGPQIGQFLQ